MEKKKERRIEKAERTGSQAEGCEGEGSDKQDVLSCVSEGDAEGCNQICDENERREGTLPVQNLHQPCHQPCGSCRYVSKGHHSR